MYRDALRNSSTLPLRLNSAGISRASPKIAARLPRSAGSSLFSPDLASEEKSAWDRAGGLVWFRIQDFERAGMRRRLLAATHAQGAVNVLFASAHLHPRGAFACSTPHGVALSQQAPSRTSLQDWRLDLEEAVILQVAPDRADDLGARAECVPNLRKHVVTAGLRIESAEAASKCSGKAIAWGAAQALCNGQHNAAHGAIEQSGDWCSVMVGVAHCGRGGQAQKPSTPHQKP